MEAILQIQELIYIKTNQIRWLKPEVKTCHICQGTEHKAANCSRIQDQEKNERKILKYSGIYRRKGVDADNVDSIHKKADTITQKKTYRQADQDTTPTKLTSSQTIYIDLETRLSA